MLEIVISNKKPAPVIPVYTYKPPAPAPVAPVNTTFPTESNAVFIEAKRRDEIIRNLVKNMPYKRGDWCVPKTDKGKKDYGRCQVTHVAENYASLGRDYKWDSDNPLIVTCRTENNTIFFCSVNYLEKENANAA